MVMEYGMSEKLGPISFGKEQGEVFLGRDIGHSRDFSEEVASMIDKEIRSLVDEAYKRAETILSENEDKLHEVAKALLEKEKLTAEEFNAIMDGKGLKEISADIIKEETPKEENTLNEGFNPGEVKLQAEEAKIEDIKKEEI